ncbi:MAG TPA: 3'-5' exonuclease, partial [Tissierellaceae bacterium]|nr:3'-5' exonuclease [Tissierellaceae bacterium]
IQDIIDFMSFAQDTSNMEIYERIFYKKKGFISRRQINYAKTLNHNLSVFQRIKDFPGINSFYERNLNQLDLDFKKLSKLKPKDAISFIEYDLEYDQYLRDNSMKFGYTYDNLVTILYFLKMMAEKTNNLGQLISRLNHVKSICEKPPYKNKGVTLSTIHSAKGLEFERVYMIDLIDGEFPNYTSIEKFLTGNPNLMEEERRLFYVGMSRAKSELNLLTVKYINGRSVSPSRFLNELEKITNS